MWVGRSVAFDVDGTRTRGSYPGVARFPRGTGLGSLGVDARRRLGLAGVEGMRADTAPGTLPLARVLGIGGRGKIRIWILVFAVTQIDADAHFGLAGIK